VKSDCRHIPRNIFSSNEKLICKKCGKKIVPKKLNFLIVFILSFLLGQYIKNYLHIQLGTYIVLFFLMFISIFTLTNLIIGYKESDN
jgi:hypothetical protein